MGYIQLPPDHIDASEGGFGSVSPSKSRKIYAGVALGIAAVTASAILGAAVLPSATLPALDLFGDHPHKVPQCPAQVEPLAPQLEFRLPEGYANASAHRLSQAVQFPTVSYDDNGPVKEDPRWQVFYKFHTWLEDTFADVFNRDDVTLTKVNELALLTEIRGTDSSLKPLMLTSHIDVVPVPDATLDRWTYPPFSGHWDGEFIWGCGVGDCKTLVVAQYEALSLLFAQGWRPRRSVVLAHGFDEEELSARQGAGHLSPYIEGKYGKDSMLLLIDEGSGSQDLFGTAFAAPATGEKGYLDVLIRIGTPGGHSSIPPAHTGIGLMSEVVRAIEANPHLPSFDGPMDPVLQSAMCAENHSEAFPKAWRHIIRRRQWKQLAKEFAKKSLAFKSVISTTQAVDIISGGVKVNALPEVVTAIVNHRIAFAESVASVQEHIAKVIEPVAKKFDLAFHPFNASSDSVSPTSTANKLGNRYIQLEVYGIPLEPAPKSPTSGAVWDMFAGSIRSVYKDDRKGGKPYYVTPSATTGNTDTKVYWNLTRHIYRFMGNPVLDYDGGYHTVDEKASIKSHLTILQWIHTIIQNTDAYDGPQ